MLRSVVLTGGPGAGKTVIASRLAGEHPRRFVLVPEAATQVYRTLGTRWNKLDVAGRRDAQRRIYRLQIEQEDRLMRANPGRTLLLDRGTVDGAAYWPDGPGDYWRDLATTARRELARYDAAIWLQCSATLGVYDGKSSNPCRFENAAAAIRRGEALAELWRAHPNFRTVDAYPSLEQKLAAVKKALEELDR